MKVSSNVNILRVFTPVTPHVMTLTKSLPDKHCASDPLPTWLLKDNVELLAPFLCHLLNWSLEHGVVPAVFKSDLITPRLKKPDLDPSDFTSYRPISVRYLQAT